VDWYIGRNVMVHFAASVFRVIQEHLLDLLDDKGSKVIQMLVNIYWSMWHKIPDDFNVRQHVSTSALKIYCNEGEHCHG
jgi:hypothetical protein